MKASKQEYLKHVLSQLKMAIDTENGKYISIYSLELDDIIDNKFKFDEHE